MRGRPAIGRLALILAATLTLAGAARATSTARMPPHDPAQARAAIEEFFRLVDTGNEQPLGSRFLIYTDDLGQVLGREELGAFLAKMNAPEGHADTAPIRVERIRRLVDHRYQPIYLVEISRTRWFPEQEDILSMSIEPAGYRSATETWLVHFQSDRIFSVREAYELWQLIDPSSIPRGERL